jgi:hypothetical protein
VIVAPPVRHRDDDLDALLAQRTHAVDEALVERRLPPEGDVEDDGPQAGGAEALHHAAVQLAEAGDVFVAYVGQPLAPGERGRIRLVGQGDHAHEIGRLRKLHGRHAAHDGVLDDAVERRPPIDEGDSDVPRGEGGDDDRGHP